MPPKRLEFMVSRMLIDYLTKKAKPRWYNIWYIEVISRIANCTCISLYTTTSIGVFQTDLVHMAELYSAPHDWETSVQDLKRMAISS